MRPGGWQNDRRARLWVVRAPETPHPDHVSLLDIHEQTRFGRLATSRLQARYACAHALLRSVLAPLLDQPPERISLAPGEFQRPALADGSRERLPGLDFNLSGSGPWLACALAHDVRVGVDLELGEGRIDVQGLATRLFNPDEQAWMNRQDDLHAGFCRLWSLKEAVAKAHGEGVGLDFPHLRTVPDTPNPATLSVDLEALQQAGDWRLLSLEGPRRPDSALALALWGEDIDGTIDLAPPCPEGFEPAGVAALAEGCWSP